MLFGYIPTKDEKGERVELAFLASYPDLLSKPILMRMMQPTESAVYFLSPREAISVSWDEKDNARVFLAVPPSVVYLSPDSAEKPGILAVKLKLTVFEDGNFEIQYARKMEDPWMKWSTKLATR